jgi:hypothetical protein
MARFYDLTSGGLVISPRVCIVDNKAVETTSCIIWTVLLILTVQLTILHVAVIVADKVTQLLTPCFLRLALHICAGLEECCDTQNWKCGWPGLSTSLPRFALPKIENDKKSL